MENLIKKLCGILIINKTNESVNRGFRIVENMGTITVSESAVGKRNHNDLFQALSSIKNSQVRFSFFDDTNDNRLSEILISIVKSDIEEKNQLLEVFFKDMPLFRISRYLDVLKRESVLDKDSSNYYKKYAFLLLGMPKDKEKYNGGTLKSILESLNYYTYTPEDYTALFKLFSIYEKDIKHNFFSNERDWFFKFLKAKINPYDWYVFSNIHKVEIQNKNKEVFKENNNKKLLLELNTQALIKLYPKFSLGCDINIASSRLVSFLNEHSAVLDLESLKIVENHENKIEILFISVENKEISKKLMEIVILELLDHLKIEEDNDVQMMIKKIELIKLDFKLTKDKHVNEKVNKI